VGQILPRDTFSNHPVSLYQSFYQHHTTKMPSLQSKREDIIATALTDVATEKFTSIRQCALFYGISRSVLARRVKEGRSPMKAMMSRQILDPDQEGLLFQVISDYQSQNIAVSNASIRELGKAIAGKPGKYGKSWLTAFKRRWPALRTGRGKPIESKRVAALTPAIVDDHFDQYEKQVIRNSVEPANTWNMDELGYQKGQCQGEIFVYNKDIGRTVISRNDTTTWTTILECSNACGDSMPPFLIHSGKELYRRDLPDPIEDEDIYPGWYFTVSPKGWTNDVLAVEWLEKVFIPIAKERARGAPVALILDGHGSHCTGAFLYRCWQKDIHLVYLPPHTSHILQPQDLGTYSSLKKYYSDEIKQYIVHTGQATITRSTFNDLYRKARSKALARKLVVAGWVRSGLFPLNRSRILTDPMVQRTVVTLPDLSQPKASKTTRSVTPTNEDRIQYIIDHPEEVNATPRSRRMHRALARSHRRLEAANRHLSNEISKQRQLMKASANDKRRQKVVDDREKRAVTLQDVQDQIQVDPDYDPVKELRMRV
jgi:hypothetical protein